MDDAYHIPVLLHEAVDLLVTERAGIYVDGTLGGGGHAALICEKIFPDGELIGIDADEDAQHKAKQTLARFAPRVTFVHDNTAFLRSILRSREVTGIRGLLLDLGVSSHQLDEHGKGFTFRADAPLDMRMDVRQMRDARSIVNEYDEHALADLFFQYGEEKQSRRIARAIAAQRHERPIDTTGELAAIVERCVGGKFVTKSLARIFQALRIEVNDELGRLETMLRDGVELLAPGGRIVVIAYHSLEDRIVKNYFAEQAATVTPSGVKFLPDAPREPVLRLLTKKPLMAAEEEQRMNPRSRSAKLRAAEKV